MWWRESFSTQFFIQREAEEEEEAKQNEKNFWATKCCRAFVATDNTFEKRDSENSEREKHTRKTLSEHFHLSLLRFSAFLSVEERGWNRNDFYLMNAALKVSVPRQWIAAEVFIKN